MGDFLHIYRRMVSHEIKILGMGIKVRRFKYKREKIKKVTDLRNMKVLRKGLKQ